MPSRHRINRCSLRTSPAPPFFSDPGYAANGSIISHTRNTVCVGLGLISYNIITYKCVPLIIYYFHISIYIYIYMRYTYIDQPQVGIYMDLPLCKKSISYHSSRGDVYPEGASWRLINFDIKIKEYMEILNHPR